MTKNKLLELENHGQSIWLDYISRDLINSGKLSELIKNDHLKGITSNPSIFEKAIAKTKDYDDTILKVGKKALHNAQEVYETLAIKDIQDAADLLRPVYDAQKGADGFVSLEVSPKLAFDAEGSIKEGKRLWDLVNRPNLMIKIPGTPEGMVAIRELTSAGINVNVTLLFSTEAYRDAALAYLAGLGDRVKKGLPINFIHSVASFFVSRIDTLVDEALEKIIADKPNSPDANRAQSLLGTIAIANAKKAYLIFEELYQSDDAKKLIQQGANPQRLLWASTSTKNKNYPDVLYVDTLIGKNTVNTLPPATLDAFRDHGCVSDSLKENILKAPAILKELASLGIDFKACCEKLMVDGVKLFTGDFDKLLNAIDQKLSDKAL